MLVNLRSDWFAPNGHLYRKGVVNVPEKFKDVLPPTAKVQEKAPEPEAKQPIESLRDHDPERAAADAEEAVRIEAEAEAEEAEKRRQKAAELQRELEAEKRGKRR